MGVFSPAAWKFIGRAGLLKTKGQKSDGKSVAFRCINRGRLTHCLEYEYLQAVDVNEPGPPLVEVPGPRLAMDCSLLESITRDSYRQSISFAAESVVRLVVDIL